ncbi:MAG: amidohydrolase [Flavobacteriaceae bacterium]
MKIFIRIIIVVLAVALTGYFYIIRDFKKAEATLYKNANIITLDDDMPQAQAMIVANGKIVAVGTNDVLSKLKNQYIKVVNLKGKTVLPGFIDSHSHVALSAFLEPMVDLSGFKHKTPKDVWQYLAKSVKKKKKGEWLIGKGIDPVLVEGLKSPSLSFLDSVAPDNPLVLISQSLHSYWVNSKTLEIVGIDKNTQNPSKSSYYERDSLGNLTGMIAEQVAFKPVLDVLQKEVFTPKALTKATSNVFKQYAKNGNTSVISAGISINNAKPLRLYQHLSAEKPTFINQLLAKIGLLPKREVNPRHFIYIRRDKDFLLPEKKTDNDFYNIIGVKMWYDGSPYTGSMYLKEPYVVSDLTQNGLHIPNGSRGKALIQKDSLVKFIERYTSKGWQIAIHAQGDAATEEVVNAFSEANKVTDITKFRDRLEHCILLQESTFNDIERLNLVPNFHINHLYYYGKALKNDIIGTARAETILPVGEAQRRRLKYAMHADQPMFESAPFRLIQTAIERTTKEGDTLGYNQHITVLQGLKAMTYSAAWQIFMEDKLGSLTKGKYADFIVVDKNPLTISTKELQNIKVLNTYVNGNEIKFN